MRTKHILVSMLFPMLISPGVARADFWGGDLIYLAQILDNAIKQYQKLREVTQYGRGTLDQLREINQGLKRALELRETLNRRLRPGVLSDKADVLQLIGVVEDLYGKIPKTPQARLQQTTDISIAESLHFHNEAFRYADKMDPKAEELKRYGEMASQKYAIRASVQGQGMIIHVLNQILRTNAAILKMQSQNVAMLNRRSKVESRHYQKQYKSLGKAFQEINSSFDLPSIKN